MVQEKRLARETGVTLIEMLVVVTIIALFAVLVGLPMLKYVGKARGSAARVQIDTFNTALHSYNFDTGTFPTNEQGLQALRVKPGDLARWDGPYLPKEIPFDPWGRPYIYRYPGEHGNEFDIISFGADGAPGGEGDNADIVSWSNK